MYGPFLSDIARYHTDELSSEARNARQVRLARQAQDSGPSFLERLAAKLRHENPTPDELRQPKPIVTGWRGAHPLG